MSVPFLTSMLLVPEDRQVMWQEPDGAWQTGTVVSLPPLPPPPPNESRRTIVRLDFSGRLYLVETWRLRDRIMNPE